MSATSASCILVAFRRRLHARSRACDGPHTHRCSADVVLVWKRCLLDKRDQIACRRAITTLLLCSFLPHACVCAVCQLVPCLRNTLFFCCCCCCCCCFLLLRSVCPFVFVFSFHCSQTKFLINHNLQTPPHQKSKQLKKTKNKNSAAQPTLTVHTGFRDAADEAWLAISSRHTFVFVAAYQYVPGTAPSAAHKAALEAQTLAYLTWVRVAALQELTWSDATAYGFLTQQSYAPVAPVREW